MDAPRHTIRGATKGDLHDQCNYQERPAVTGEMSEATPVAPLIYDYVLQQINGVHPSGLRTESKTMVVSLFRDS